MNFLRNIGATLSPIYPLAKRLLYKFHGGVFPKYNKTLSARTPIRAIYLPSELILPLPQAVGEVRQPLVKVGDQVLKNQLLAQSDADPESKLVVPMHAPTSGEIIAIEARTLPHASGLQELCIILKPDGQDKAIENALNSDGTWPSDAKPLKDIIAKSGIIGMGGAGFPTYAKLPRQKGQVKHLIINGAECEPFISCDDLLMQTDSDEIWLGAQIVAHALGCGEILCGIETNKPQAIEKMRSASKNLQKSPNVTTNPLSAMKVQEVATVYPMGGQKQLVFEMTGVELQSGSHAIDQGILMMNVATLKAIYRAVQFGEPLTSRLVTVSGEGLSEGFNIQALIGTPFNELANLAKPKGDIDYPLIMGGPMMGVQMPDNHVPILKTTNCVLANPPEPRQMQMPCIRCGECMDACPVNLLPQQMYWHTQGHEYEKVEKLNIKDCIECGCCSYVCPSHIPLVQYYRHAKSEIKVINAEKQAVELAKQRHEFKLARIEREKAEREARLKAKKEAVKKQAKQTQNTAAESKNSTPKSAAKSATSAAAARAAAAKAAAAKKAKSAGSSENSASKPMSAREKAILAAQKAAANKQGQSDKDFKTKGHSLGSKNDRQAAAEAAKKRAAMAAAKAKAKTSVRTSDEPNEVSEQEVSSKTSAREKAIAAARTKAAKAAAAKKRKQVAETSNAVTTVTKESEQTVDLSDKSNKSSPALEKELARKAAVQKAREAALARKKASTNKQTEEKDSNHTETSEKPIASKADSAEQDPKTATRKAAMEAAKRAAAKRAAAKKESNE